jgi:predicted nucleotidyltransferase
MRNPDILAIILYGSYARKDHSIDSDCDICVFTREKTTYRIDQETIMKYIDFPAKNIEISQYSLKLLDTMLDYGSLFLWHLRDEGRIIYGKKFIEKKFKCLKKFADHKSQLLYYQEIFNDLRKFLLYSKFPNELDLSILFTLTRNVCLMLSHKIGLVTFNKLDCFKIVMKNFRRLPFTLDEYTKLLKWKLLYERNIDSHNTLPNIKEYKRIISRVGGVIDYAIKEM